MCMDREIFEKNLGKQVILINNEHFLLKGVIEAVYDSSIAFRSNDKLRYLDFIRIEEVRILGGK